MLAFEDVVCIQAEMEEINRVYRSDAPVRLGPDELPCMGYTFVVKRKTGMETYIALHARDIKRSLIYRVDPTARNVGDPSSQLKGGLDLLRGLGLTLDPINLKYGAAMLEVVLQDVPVLMSPAKAKKNQLERNANLTALETQATFLKEHNLLSADDKTLAKLSRDERNRYNTAKSSFEKLTFEDRCDEQREFLFDHVDALLHGRTPPKPGSAPAHSVNETKPTPQPPPPKKAVEPKPAPKPKPAPEPAAAKQNDADSPAPKAVTKVVADPKDKERIEELEKNLAELQELVETLSTRNTELERNLAEAESDLRQAKKSAAKLKDLEVEVEEAHQTADEAQKEVRRLKSDNAKYCRKIEELDDQLARTDRVHDEPVRPRSRLNSGRSMLSSSGSGISSKPAVDPPHVVRRPPPAGATFGVDWDLDHLPCDSLEQVVELHQSICNAQLTLEGYQTQYCSAFIVVLKENGGRQLYMVFKLPQEERFLLYKPIKKPTSSGDLARLLKEAHKFLQVVGVETEKINLKPGQELPSHELAELLSCS